MNILWITQRILVQSAGVAEYTDCISAEGKDFPDECPAYDTKQSDGEAPVMLELWGMQNTPPLPLLSGPHWPRLVVLDRVLSRGQIELLAFKLCTYAKLNCFK